MRSQVLSRIERKSLRDDVSQALRNSILRLEAGFEPDSKLSTAKIADALGVSPTPVKEALLTLEAEGLVKMSPGKSARVTAPTPQDVLDFREVRHGLERWAVTAPRGPLDAKVKGAMEECLRSWAAAIDARDMDSMHACHARFHQLIVSSSGNSTLAEIYQALSSRFRIMDAYQRQAFGDPKDEIRRHRELLGVLMAGNTELAKKAIDDHFEVGTRRILRAIKRNGARAGIRAPATATA